MSHKEVVIYDLEFTTWPGAIERNWSGIEEYREIISIGAIRVDLDNLQEIEAMEVIVKPSVNPSLSDYCTNLTGITDGHIKVEGIEIHEALQKFASFIEERNIFSYGFDIVVILENLRLNNIQFNAKTLNRDRSIILKEYHKDNGNQIESPHELNVLEVPLYGPGHREALKRISDGVHVEMNLYGNCVKFSDTNIKPWFHANAFETQGKCSGEIAKIFSTTELKGNIHSPLFDVRSILIGLRELVLSRHAESPLK